MDLKKKREDIVIPPLFSSSKKGFVFTMLALILTAFFVVVFSADVEQGEGVRMTLVESRINMLSFYVENFYDYAENTGSITGYFALQNELKEMNGTIKNYRQDLESEFINCSMYGYMNSTKNCSNMINNTLTYYLSKINNMAQTELKISSTYSINSIRVTQERDPFLMDVVMNITLNVSDIFANISSTRILSSTIYLDGIQDPLYLVNGSYNQIINKTNITKREGNWMPEDLQELYITKTYRRTPSGISFINRLKGNFTNSSMGIESYVNHTLVASTSVNYSCVDYLFWNKVELNCEDGRVVFLNETIMPLIPYPPLLQIDDAHRLMFNISNIYSIRTC